MSILPSLQDFYKVSNCTNLRRPRNRSGAKVEGNSDTGGLQERLGQRRAVPFTALPQELSNFGNSYAAKLTNTLDDVQMNHKL